MSTFDAIIGQPQIVSTLKEAVAAAKNLEDTSQEMTHAWLFTGPPGSGRSNAAIAFAAALLCPKNGCNDCIDCTTAQNGTHIDIELIKTEGLSLKIDDIHELLSRSSWAPSVSGWRIVVMKDADRLTEAAANALLKAIEEPGARTVWLLCAPTITDVLPTIRSRCRHLLLRTPSQEAIVALLTSRDGIDPKMATFAARIAQGHIGRAKYLATNSESRSRRLQILNLPLKINDISAAFRAAATLLELATQDAESGAEERDDKELKSLQDAYQGTGRGLISGGSKAVKDLEKEQKSRQTRAVRDSIDNSLLDIATLYRDVMLLQSGSTDFLINTDLLSEVQKIAESTTPELTVKKIESIMQARTNLSHNAAPLLTLEALMCSLK